MTTPVSAPAVIGEPFDRELIAAGVDPAHVMDIARGTLAEDLRWGPDVTTLATIRDGQYGVAEVVSRQAGTIAGIPVAAAVLCAAAEQHGSDVDIDPVVSDGSRVTPSAVVLRASGPLRTLLTAERSMLNLLSQLSGVATATSAWIAAIGDYRCAVRDTRKTVPGLRVLQKYAVSRAGGSNHRMGLGDAALIKDNHIAAAGSVAAALAAMRQYDSTISVEVECDTIDQVHEALDAGADLILLDNMCPEQMRACVEAARKYGTALEASGGISIDMASDVAATGVDYISVGALTHSVTSLDLGFDLANG